MEKRPTKPPPAPPIKRSTDSTIQDELSSYSSNASKPPRPPPPRFLRNQLHITNAERITELNPKTPVAEKIHLYMLKIACQKGIATSTLPDANALVEDNRPVNLVRLVALLHQLAQNQWKSKKKSNNRKKQRKIRCQEYGDKSGEKTKNQKKKRLQPQKEKEKRSNQSIKMKQRRDKMNKRRKQKYRKRFRKMNLLVMTDSHRVPDPQGSGDFGLIFNGLFLWLEVS